VALYAANKIGYPFFANFIELEEFFDAELPEYAILSHTWGREEVSQQDLQNVCVSRPIDC
jgi:hypothetical protein